MCKYEYLVVAVEVGDMVGAEWIERRDMGGLSLGH